MHSRGPHASMRTLSIATEPTARRIAVLYVSCGGGHRSVAEAIREQLGADIADVDGTDSVSCLDILAVLSRRVRLDRWAAWLYFAFTRRSLRWAYRLLFTLADRYPGWLASLCCMAFGRRTRQWLVECRPTLIVSTHPQVSAVCGRAIAALGMNCHVISVVTDGGRVNRSWFEAAAHVVAVTDDATMAFATDNGLAARSQLVRIFPPLRRSAVATESRLSARRRLYLTDEPTLLIWGGAQGLAAGLEAFAAELCARRLPFNVIAVLGNNESLRKRFEKLQWPNGARIYGVADEIGLLLSASDVVIGKAGWISLAEADAAGLHTFCVDALPGQEQENLRVACEEGRATGLPDSVALLSVLERMALMWSEPQSLTSPPWGRKEPPRRDGDSW
jgi:processive 1,2-diacylglycerol beta-glucosyltransferase